MKMSDSWTIICSPVSGKKQGRQYVEHQLIPELKSRGISYQVHYTERFQHAKQLAKGHSRIICVGGDGTVNEVLESCPPQATIAVVSQGTMNFFGVCSDLPGNAKELVDLIALDSSRPCSLMRVNTHENSQHNNKVSFEALHIGPMAHRVCKGAQDWRFTPLLGSMFGIVLHLILGNIDPKHNKQRGTLKFWPVGGGPAVRVSDDFFWIILTYRNPYNGVVGNELWCSWMTLETFPGFDRMMTFFEPQMEHFQGTSRCFGCHARVIKAEFILDEAEREDIALVLDGDPQPCGRTLEVSHAFGAFRVVAKEEPPIQVNTASIAVGGAKLVTRKPLTKHAAAWLTMYPPPKGMTFPEPLAHQVQAEGASQKGKIFALLLFVAIVVYTRRHRALVE